MAIERTLAIIKPDAVGRGLAGEILVAHSQGRLSDRRPSNRCGSRRRSRRFLRRASRTGFFGELTAFMSSGKIVVMALEAEGAIPLARDHGRHRSRQGRARHHPPRLRRQHPEQLHARFGRSGNRRFRNRLLFRRPRTDLTFFLAAEKIPARSFAPFGAEESGCRITAWKCPPAVAASRTARLFPL